MKTNRLSVMVGGMATSFAMAFSASAQCQSACKSTETDVANAEVIQASYSKPVDIVDTAVAAGDFNTLVAAVKAANLVTTLKGTGPFTVFAPSDEAFAKLPKSTLEDLLKPENRALLTSILTYHVVPGTLKASDVVNKSGAVTVNGQRIAFESKKSSVMVDNARVVATDIECSNGIIHVIDTVIMPATDNIVETAQSAGTFSTLIAAAQAAGIAPVLAGEGPLTVFAPTDDAFAKLPPGTVENLLKPENKEKLANILKYHVVSGRMYSDSIARAGSLNSLLGQKLTVRAKGESMTIGTANIVKSDIDASNGVVFVIDTVLLPQ